MAKTKPGLTLKTPAEIELLAESGRRLAKVLYEVAATIKPGVKAIELEELAAKLIKEADAEPTFKGFHGYPAVSCVSINDQIVHGLPTEQIIHPGDLVGLDVGLRYKGWCTDMAVTVGVPPIDKEAKTLLAVTEESLTIGLAQVKPGNRLGDVAHAIQEYVEDQNFGVVRDLTGHGIGRQPHEEPSVPNFGKPGTGLILEEGMVLAIEPMVTMGKPAVKQLQDGWTIATVDGSLAAHFEHTIAVTKDGYRILTQS